MKLLASDQSDLLNLCLSSQLFESHRWESRLSCWIIIYCVNSYMFREQLLLLMNLNKPSNHFLQPLFGVSIFFVAPCKSFSMCSKIKLFLNLVIFKNLYLVKMSPIFDSSPPVFGTRYQSFLRVCWFLPKGVPYFGYPSENLTNPTDIIVQKVHYAV